jgi:HEPN domain-containing protein
VKRTDFQQLSNLRLKEAKALLDAGFPEGAYYLAGYSVECALKACIAKRTHAEEFPERDAHKYYKHDLQELLVHAQLKQSLDSDMQRDPLLEKRWTILKSWSEEARYIQGKTAHEAMDLIGAIEDGTGGILPWLQQRW